MPERSALASQVDYGQSELESLSRPMVNVAVDCRPIIGNNCSTSGRLVGPRADPRQWTRGTFA